MSAKLKNRHRIKQKDIKQYINKLKEKFGEEFIDFNSSVEIGYFNEYQIVVINDEIDFILIEDNIFFTLSGLNKYKPKDYFVEVDMGAVGFVTNGADIMAPGIVDIDTKIEKDDFVWIRDVTHHKPLAIGKALMDGEEIIKTKKGKAIKNLHYVGDELWHFYQQI